MSAIVSEDWKQGYVEREFLEPFWIGWRVISWLAFRDPLRICDISDRESRIALDGYPDPKPTSDLLDKRPEDTLRHAVLAGELAAFQNDRSPFPVIIRMHRWTLADAFFQRDDVLAKWPSATSISRAIDIGAKQIFPEGKRGPKPKYNWPAFYAELTLLNDHHGGFSVNDPEWSSQADAERAMTDWCDKTWGNAPAPSRIRHYVKVWIENCAPLVNSR